MKKIFTSVLFTLLVSATLFGGGTVNDKIDLVEDGTGDFIIGGAFFANKDGWKTDLRVVNTNITATSIVKVSIADGRESGDLLDFAIYLTPGDVWSGTLYYDASKIDPTNNCGGVFMYSDDDSLVTSAGKASDGPLDICLGTGLRAIGADLNDNFGYIEVIGMAEIAGVKTINGVTTDFSTAPVDKIAVYNAYMSYQQVGEIARENAMIADGWTSVGNDAVGLEVNLIDEVNALSMSYRGVAFENFMGGRVVSNGVVSKDIVFKDYSNKTQTDLINEVEAAIIFDSVDFNYYETAGATNETVLIMTSVTKRERFVDGTIGTIWELNTSAPAPVTSSDYCAGYTWQSRDMQEHTIKQSYIPPEFSGGVPGNNFNLGISCNEASYIRINDMLDYPEGLFSFVMFGLGTTIPAIPLVLTVKSVNGTNVADKITPFLHD